MNRRYLSRFKGSLFTQSVFGTIGYMHIKSEDSVIWCSLELVFILRFLFFILLVIF